MNDDKLQARERALTLLKTQRWAALATLDRHGLPEGAMVAYAMASTDEGHGLYLHLSQLASHTRNLLQNPHVALIIGEADTGNGDPQQLARLSLQGEVRVISPEDPPYTQAKGCYLARFPNAEQRFDFGDFRLFRFDWQRARWIGGFGQAYSYCPADLWVDP